MEKRDGWAKVEVLEGREWTSGQIAGPVSGVYVSGSEKGLTRAVSEWLPQAPIVIVHDLGEEAVELINAGAVTLAIDQNPEEQAARSIAVLLGRFGLVSGTVHTGLVPFTLHTRHNLPA